jgi:hypothetical protein
VRGGRRPGPFVVKGQAELSRFDPEGLLRERVEGKAVECRNAYFDGYILE